MQALEVRKCRVPCFTQVVYTCPIAPTRKVFPHKCKSRWPIYTSRFSSQVTLHKEDGAFSVDNGSEDPIQLFSKDSNIIAATFSKVALRNMGGSECFWRKKLHFYDQLQSSLYHGTDTHREILPLLIDRRDILNSVCQ